MKKFILFVFAFSILAACKNDADPVTPVKETLNFGKLKLGDRLDFIRFITTCDNFDGDFELTGDTLAWTVDLMSTDSILFKEEFTPGSPLAATFDPVKVKATSANEKHVIIPNRWNSNLFFFYGNDTLRVNPIPTINLGQQNCQLMLGADIFRGDEIAFIDKVQIEDYEFKNMTVVSCVPGSVGEAYIIFDNGNIKAIFSKDFFSDNVSGWIALD